MWNESWFINKPQFAYKYILNEQLYRKSNWWPLMLRCIFFLNEWINNPSFCKRGNWWKFDSINGNHFNCSFFCVALCELRMLKFERSSLLPAFAAWKTFRKISLTNHWNSHSHEPPTKFLPFFLYVWKMRKNSFCRQTNRYSLNILFKAQITYICA